MAVHHLNWHSVAEHKSTPSVICLMLWTFSSVKGRPFILGCLILGLFVRFKKQCWMYSLLLLHHHIWYHLQLLHHHFPHHQLPSPPLTTISVSCSNTRYTTTPPICNIIWEWNDFLLNLFNFSKQLNSPKFVKGKKISYFLIYISLCCRYKSYMAW